jgi:predicted Zn finger-like uncharacterized protein
MIATCPHCQSGFYISPDMAGNVINCSKCKKQVRAPDRRARGLPSSNAPPADGIPMAIIAETKAEVEERLKNETEAKHELEQRLRKERQTLAELQERLLKETEAKRKAEQAALALAEKLKKSGLEVPESEIESLKENASKAQKNLQDAIEARTKAEEQVRAESHAKAEAQEQLKQLQQTRTELESKLSTETEARKKAEEAMRLENQGRAELEARLKAESEARARAESLRGKEGEGLSKLENKIQEAEAARARAESQAQSESQTKANLEKQLKEERDLRGKLESQWRAEIMAKRKMQTQLESEEKTREKAEAGSLELKAKLQELEKAEAKRKSINLSKGLMCLTVPLSFIFAAVAGYIAYTNGYTINGPFGHFDRPVHLPIFEQPVYLPINLVAISVAGFLSAWGLYLIELFIIRGFRKPQPTRKQPHQTEPQVEEIVSFSEPRPWRSS